MRKGEGESVPPQEDEKEEGEGGYGRLEEEIRNGGIELDGLRVLVRHLELSGYNADRVREEEYPNPDGINRVLAEIALGKADRDKVIKFARMRIKQMVGEK